MQENTVNARHQGRHAFSYRSRILSSLFAISLLGLNVTSPLSGERVDQKVAEWALREGGTITLAGQTERILTLNQLPDGDLRLEILDLVGTNIKPPDLARLSELRYLKELHLPQPMWIRHPELENNQNLQMRHLVPITSLEKLTFSYFFREFNGRFTDEGIEQIAPLTNLKEFRVRRAAVRVTCPLFIHQA